MRITIVQGPYFPVPPLLASGVEKFWFGMGAEFARRGHQVVHVSRRFPGLSDRETSSGVEHRRIPSRDAPRGKLAYRAYDLMYSLRALRALPIGADILVTNCLWLPLLIRGDRHGKLYVHVGRFPKGQMRLYRHAARIQAVSTVVAAQARHELGARADRVRVLPYFHSNALSTNAAPIVAERAREILYVGRLHPEKGVHLLIDAFAQADLSDWRLTVIGSHEIRHGGGGAAYRARLRGMAQAAGERIGFVGLVADTGELNRHLDRASLLVYPSLAEKGEALPMVPIEAMARGCPVLVSDLACFRDYIRPGENGHVFDHRGEDAATGMAAAMQAALADEAERRRIAWSGYETSRGYRLETVAQRYLDDFSSL